MQSSERPLQLDVTTVAEMQQRGDDFLLLDVREQEEDAIAKINGSLLMPISEIGARLHELNDHQDRLIIVYCHHGGRSLQVTQALRARGFSKVQNMEGGIDQWSQTIDPSLARY
ncbi:MAG: rhodanese-like domain-containing protein [Novipirellula sp. JB048]